MISENMKKRNRILLICEHSIDLNPGDSFEKVELSDSPVCGFVPEQTDIVCCGKISEEEMLFRSGDGRYYFSLKDGWGTENGKLYGISKGLFVDFSQPTAEEAVVAECEFRKSQCSYHSWLGAMAYRCKTGALDKIISVMVRRQSTLPQEKEKT